MSYTLKSRIPLIIAELKPSVLEGVKESAERVVDDAKGRVPVDSGALRDAIHVESDDTKGSVEIIAGDSDAFYGHIVENGGVNTPPRPFLVPAFEAERESLEETIGERLRDL